ncbi:uncharacterized protein F5147DRAFT_586908, partial [Suillus discolor]
LTEQDRDNIRAFQLKLLSCMPWRMYNAMRTSFDHKISIDSEWIILRCLALLSEIEPRAIDCCVNLCIAYTREHSLREDCPYCNEARFTSSRQPHHTFSYLPLIPRLQAFFQNKAMINLLRYRSEFEPHPTRIHDVFDSSWYRKLLRKHVVVDGTNRNHKYFNSEYDLALAMCTDGYLFFQMSSWWPICYSHSTRQSKSPPLIFGLTWRILFA